MEILKKLIYTLSVAICQTGCTSEFEPNIDSTPVLCMNAVMNVGEPVDVHLTHTWRYSSRRPADLTVKDAVVSVWVNGRHVEDVSYNAAGEAGYKTSYMPQYGDDVRLVAESKEYGCAEGRTIVPDAARIDTVKCDVVMEPTWYMVSPTNGFRSVSISMKLDMQMMVNDPADVNNYYQLDWGSYAPRPEYDPDRDHQTPFVSFQLGGIDYDAEPLFAEHIGALETVSGSDAYGFTVFSDRQIQGRTYPLHVRFKS
ncbi:MAG: DUF4249 domain-containing protein, partial [Muribaculaceae bacterium]|nr:DUF4249 domain-containing protein [Muribaculaceae bacterium]